MTYNRTHLQLRILGHFGASTVDVQDHWSTGLKLAVVGGLGASDGPYTTLLESIAPAVQTFHTGTNSFVGPRCFLDELTIAKIDFDGSYFGTGVTTHRLYGTPIAGGSGSQNNPWNTALVTSLRTGFLRGYASNGRMYYPAIAIGIDSNTGRVAQVDVQNRLNAMKVMLDAINTAANALQTGLKIHVMSKVGSGTSGMVTSIRSDNRLDSIERRENDQVSSWSTATIA